MTNRTTPAPALALPPRLGDTVNVRVGEGLVLRNADTGTPFPADTAVPQLVTPTLLRRLADGDLVLAG